MSFILACIYFYAPAALANVGAVIGRFIPIFNRIKTPIDLGIRYKGQRLVGDHKVYGSFLFGIVFGSVVGFLKYTVIDPHFSSYLILHLSLQQTMVLYSLMSAFALIGDLIKSILKRLLNIEPHKAWVPFDEIDHSVTSLFVASLFFPIPFKVSFTIVFVYFFLHVSANIIGYKLRIKKVPY